MINKLLLFPVIVLLLSNQMAGCNNPQDIISDFSISFTPSPSATTTPTSTKTYKPSPTNTIPATVTNTPSPTSTSTPSPTSTYTPPPTATSTPTEQPRFLVPFRDDFSDKSSGIVEENYTNLVTEYVDSSFKMNIMEAQFTQLSSYRLPFPPDISITVDIAFGQHPDTWIGIAHRMHDENNYYLFAVDGQANYKVFSITSDESVANPSYSVDTLFTSYVPQLADQNFSINNIRVDMVGNRFEFFANNILLTSLEMNNISQGGIGLVGWTTDNPDVIAFNNLKVYDYDERVMPKEADCVLVENAIETDVSNPDLRINSLGALGIDSNVLMSVQPDDLSVVFSARTLEPDNLIVMSRLTSPNGNVLYDIQSSPEDECSNNEYYSGSCGAEGEINLQFPSNPKHPLLHGDYKIELYSMGQPICDAATIIRSDTNPKTLFKDELQTIDINIWVLSKVESLAFAEERNRMQNEIRESIDNLLKQQNMQLGKLSVFNSSPTDKTMFARSNETNLSSLCKATAANIGASRALNVALIDVFDEYSETKEVYLPVLGISPIPGMNFSLESQSSCVVISLQEHYGDYRYVGATIVHEGSHFMGLTHTTEADGNSFDLFDDTLECTLNEFDLDASGEVEGHECTKADSSNYMFWQDSGNIDNYTISDQQAWVIRSHPLFYSQHQNQ